MLILAVSLGFIDKDIAEKRLDHTEETARIISGLIKKISSQITES